MGLKFVLLVNKQGQTRLAKYGDQSMTVEERRVLEGEIVRKCLARAEKQVGRLKPALPSSERISRATLSAAWCLCSVRL